MPTQNLVPISGIIQNIQGFSEDCCEQQVTIRNSDGIHNFIIGAGLYPRSNPSAKRYANHGIL